MIAEIYQSKINGSLVMPPSKSVMQRVCALALLNNGETEILNPGRSNDDLAAISIIKRLGAIVIEDKERIIIKNNGDISPDALINCGESGLSFRMFSFIAALSDIEITITGEGSLLNRSMEMMEGIFKLLEVHAVLNNGFLPLSLKGPIQSKDIVIDAGKSSQYLTGLLFAFAKHVKIPTIIQVENLVSKPYILLSLSLLKYFGYNIIKENDSRFIVYPKDNEVRNFTLTIEGDWSSASFLIVAAVIAGEITLTSLDVNSHQADKKIIEVLVSCGASFFLDDHQIFLQKSNSLKAFDFDATDCPDLFPPLVVLALYCKGISKIKGVKRLVEKESNRAMSLLSEFKKLNAQIDIEDDFMIINGGSELKSAAVFSHHDHRIAMALTICGLNISGGLSIDGAEAVNKSYPTFFESLKLLGANLSLHDDSSNNQ